MSNTQVIYPPELPFLRNKLTIFLAGPIQGALDWQKEACDLIINRFGFDQPIIVANPRRDTFPKDGFVDQVEWESYCLKQAGWNGVILFWCSREAIHHCDRAFAQTTRFELGEWLAKAVSFPQVNVVLGIEKGFTGADYIRQRFSSMFPGKPIYETLDHTCLAALVQLQQRAM